MCRAFRANREIRADRRQAVPDVGDPRSRLTAAPSWRLVYLGGLGATSHPGTFIPHSTKAGRGGGDSQRN